jgi:hypothetical protein
LIIEKAKSFYGDMKISDKCTFSEGSTGKLLDRQRDGDNEEQQAFPDIGEMCLIIGTETRNSPRLAQHLLEEMKYPQASLPL